MGVHRHQTQLLSQRKRSLIPCLTSPAGGVRARLRQWGPSTILADPTDTSAKEFRPG